MATSSQQIAGDYDAVVLGAGAAGLMCAFTAASRGRRVLVLEKANKVGKKILMSGGGRCNFTNLYIDAENYISDNPHFCKSALSRYTQWDFIAMVEQHAIEYEERKHGQLFCVNSASDILAMLLNECDTAGAVISTHCEIKSVAETSSQGQPPTSSGRYRIRLSRQGAPLTVTCQSLVVATGALSIPTLGGSGFGYEIAQQFSLPLIERQAGLVPFMFSDANRSLCERLTGIALPVEISCRGQLFSENLLFTHRGMSGPAVLQISNYWQPGDEVSINLLPGLDAVQWLQQSRQREGKIRLQKLLHQKLAKALVGELEALWWPGQGDKALGALSDRQLTVIGAALNTWTVKPSASEGYRTAEVTRGGVDTRCINSRTMETRNHPGLYFIGELMDVTGHLGGYNFQWAWSSGHSAGLCV